MDGQNPCEIAIMDEELQPRPLGFSLKKWVDSFCYHENKGFRKRICRGQRLV